MPHYHALAVAAWALVPLFAWADRTVGGAGRRSLAFGLVLLSGVLAWALTHSLTPVTIACAWIVYRSLPWKVGGGTTPRTLAEVAGAWARHSMPAGVALALYLAGAAPEALPAFLGLYGCVGAGMAAAYARKVDALAARGAAEDGRFNATLEVARGAAFGAALAASAALALGGVG